MVKFFNCILILLQFFKFVKISHHCYLTTPESISFL